jgi:hypothetical protein
MPIAAYRPVKDVAYAPPDGSAAVPLSGILSLALVETVPVEATDGHAHANNAVARARTTRITLRGRDLAAFRAADRAVRGGTLTYTLIGLNGAADLAEQAAACHSRGLRATADVPQPYTCELAFDCVTDGDYAITPRP